MDDNEIELQVTRDGTLDLFGRSAVKAKTGGWYTSSFILVFLLCSACASFLFRPVYTTVTQGLASIGYFGVCTNLILYLTKVLHEGNAVAANNVSNWIGTSYVTSLIGGFLGDAYLGRFMTAAIFLVIYFLGMILLTVSAAVHALRPPTCTPTSNAHCPQVSPEQRTVLYLALYIIAFGYGGNQPCLTSLGADQFDKEDPEEQTQALTRFFNWYYMSITFGAIVAGLLLVYVEDNLGWALGFGLSTLAAGLSVVAFFLGTTWYRQQRTGGNPFTRIAQVLVAAVHKHHVESPSDSSMLYEVDFKGSVIQGSRKIKHTNEFTYLDKAAIETEADTEKNPWRLCTITQVEEAKCIIRILPIWASNILFSTLYTQMSTLFVEQGAAMDTQVAGFRIPPASLSTFCMLSVLLSAPAYEFLVVPIGRKLTGNKRGLTSLQRMGAGLVVITAAMICAAVVENFRLKIAREEGLVHGLASEATRTVPLSVLWQIPQYFLVGASEVFTYIGQLDFFYEQSPDAVRGLGVALSPTSFALGNYVSSLLVTLVMEMTSKGNKAGWIPDNLNKGHLDYYFWLFTGISVVNLGFYLACAVWYKCIDINRDIQDESQV